MAGSTGANSSSNPSPAPPPPKILLAKPGLVTGGPINSKIGRGTGADDEAASIRSRLPSLGSLNLLSDSWDLHIDRFLPFLTENTEFKVVGIIGPPGVGKSTIMNEIYGYDGSSPGMLPPFPILSEDVRAMARHCTLGIEPRISSERIILLDTQPVFSPSVLAEIMRPDGSSTISVISGEPLSAELAHELMSIQLGILLASICNIVLVISEGVHDLNMWQLMLTVDLLKHGLPDPSSPISSHPQNSNIGSEKEYKEKTSSSEDYMATPIFVHAKVQDRDLVPHNILQLKRAFAYYFKTSSFMGDKFEKVHSEQLLSSVVPDTRNLDVDGEDRRLLVIPNRNKDDSTRGQYESFNLALWKLRDQVLSMNGASFSRTVSERDWLKNSVKIWESVKSSPIVMEYARTLQSSGMFRR
ncbi:protein SMG9-like isoform X1 [Benincasa hispida]|uniref:protein SMG9-like isoform X1 n=1 Tax=Benincasa hispida TaxID=102211 RepID=UPI001902052B|nr:protein SMG9-like isoform X1 [Benincasa hispida]